MFLHFINRVVNPLVTLKTEAAVLQFLDSEKEYEEDSEFYKNKYEPIGDYY